MINDDTTSLTYEVKSIYPRQQRRTTLNDFKDKNHSLQKHGLVEIEKQSSLFGEDIKLFLTDVGKEKLLGDDADLYIDNSISDKQLLACDKITEKKLFFSSELEEQLSLLRNSLDKEYYEGIFCFRRDVMPDTLRGSSAADPSCDMERKKRQLA